VSGVRSSALCAMRRDRDRAMTGERYVTGRELAAMMGISERTVRRMVAAGMPCEQWGYTRTIRFLPSTAIEWASSVGAEQRANAATPIRR
jgi:hypothetical protein